MRIVRKNSIVKRHIKCTLISMNPAAMMVSMTRRPLLEVDCTFTAIPKVLKEHIATVHKDGIQKIPSSLLMLIPDKYIVFTLLFISLDIVLPRKLAIIKKISRSIRFVFPKPSIDGEMIVNEIIPPKPILSEKREKNNSKRNKASSYGTSSFLLLKT